MENRASALLGVIREEIAIYRDLIVQARRKTALLIQGRSEELLESNKIEETCNIKLRILETEMSRLCSELAATLSIPREEFTLLKFAESTDQATAAEIRLQASLFRNLIDQLRGISRRNRKLVESSMRYSRGLLDLISNATGSYQGSGLFMPFPAVRTTVSHRI